MKIRLFFILTVLCMTVSAVVGYASPLEVGTWDKGNLTTMWANLKNVESDIFAGSELIFTAATGCNSDSAPFGDSIGAETSVSSFRTTNQLFGSGDCSTDPPEVTSFQSGGFIMFVTVYSGLSAGPHTMEVGIFVNGELNRVLECNYNIPYDGNWCLGCYVDPIPNAPSLTVEWGTRLDGSLTTPGKKSFTLN